MNRKILVNGKIHSMDKDDNQYEALSIMNGQIECLGNNSEIMNKKDHNTEMIDLNGKTVLPGFIDAHQHMISTGFNILNVDCSLDSIKSIVDALKERAKSTPENQWIIGWGVDESKLIENRLPNADDLSEISNPVYITRFCLHTACTNYTALNKAGITKYTDEPSGGEIVKFINGEPNGILKEKAMDLMKNQMPQKTLQEIKESILVADKAYATNGITSVHEAGIGFYTGSFDEFRAFTELSINEEFNVSVYGMILDDFFPKINNINIPFRFGNNKFKIAGLKLFSDGTLSGQTAAIRDRYVNSSAENGILMMTDQEMFEKMKIAHDNGYQIAIHAIGDRAIEQVIRIYKKLIKSNPSVKVRHRIEHAGLTDINLLNDMKRLGIVPVPHVGIINNSGDIYKKVLSKETFKGLYNLRNFIDYELHPAGSSDSPVISFNPLLGIYTAMSRHSESKQTLLPEQSITLKEAVKMYTANAAYAGYEEEVKGTLQVGKMGDVVILPKGFMNFNYDEVKDCKIHMTIKEGKITYLDNKEF